MIYDIHCHIKLMNYDYNKLMKKLEEENLYIIENGLDIEYNQFIVNIKEKYNNKYYNIALGLHPLSIKGNELEKFLNQLEKYDYIAIGEIGLDYKKICCEKQKEIQKKYFIEILKKAEELGKPVIIHSRGAERDVVEIISKFNIPKILHSYTGKLKYIRKYKNELYFSIPPAICKIPNFKHLAKEVGIERLLLETDSPFMGCKGKNYPWNVKETIEILKEMFGDIEILFDNFISIFGREIRIK